MHERTWYSERNLLGLVGGVLDHCLTKDDEGLPSEEE
jgi:hypothetical protein